MANMFAVILALVTLVTGIVWCFERFMWAPARRKKFAALNAPADDRAVSKAVEQPGWIETVASIFPVVALVLVVRSFIYEPFQIPSGSMMPTLLIGDFILVEKFAYGIKEPFTQKTLIETGLPKRGDIAVFKYPSDPKVDFIKRVVGLPGDRVSYNPLSKQITIYPACDGQQICDKALAVTYNNVQPSDFVQTFNQPGLESRSGFYQIPVNENKADGIRMGIRKESFGNVTHNILVVPGVQDQLGGYYQQSQQPLATWVVPAGHYFMMGDNRDNSLDSRYWGFVPERNLVGKATTIWMSFEKQEGEWPTGVRLSRIGGIH
ncbi:MULTISPECIES: signal peptidase I [unclassified Brenneria]|uniref:signal peptidase I n=1 Tax=unclassified Brenneria TaxID=2634434 RepID=UPI0015574AAD|nr:MULTISPECIES: signal peptidase I [unclassified Brenneria]MBJ7223284.1 signal peptidase I [Brenneria sp. L3-3C-1]MEE3644524.1 signal peptidase I [Brenneria sp. L3_3C_1]MEE3652085.1 signal peptidase I [Brenneria sp. HEZEL_4_2_4]NPD02046.1 signal peptidase I [Brenneria sp. hezel4-2-4]